MTSAALAAAVFIVCIACQGQNREQGRAQDSRASGTGSAVVLPPAVSADAALATAPDAQLAGEPAPADGSQVISELGAIPAWQAVVDRAQLLGRRGQRGVVYGRVGPAVLVPAALQAPAPAPVASHDAGAPGDATAAGDAGAPVDAGPAASAAAGALVDVGPAASADAGLVRSPYVWLIDDTEGHGALGIRIALGDKARPGDRITAGGAWQLDSERRWYWKPDSVQVLPPAPPGDLKEPQPAEPSHAIAAGALPAGARPISQARDNDAVYFQVVGPPPLSDGDGWQVADQPGSPAVATMNLPGERASYGGQDMRAPDERWQLRRGQTYWVRIGRLHRRGDKLTVNARTAPIRVL